MSSTSAADNDPQKNQPGLIKSFVKKFDAILAIGLLIIAGIFALNSITNNNSSSDSLLLSNKEIRQMLTKDTKRINLFVKSIQKIPKEIATILALQKLSKEEIDIVLESILLNSPELFGTAVAYEPHAFNEWVLRSSSYVYRKNESVYYTTLDDPKYDYFSKDWYRLPEMLQQPTWMDPYYDDGGGGVFMTTYSVPFYFFDGVKETFTGIVTVDVSIDWLTDYVTTNKKLPNSGFVVLVSENGTIISSQNKEWVVNHTIFTLAISLDVPELREIGRALQKGESGVKTIKSPLSKETMNVFYATVAANKWGIMYVIPDDTKEQLFK